MIAAARQKFSILSESIYKYASARNRCAYVLIHHKWMFSYKFSYKRSYLLSSSLNGRPFEEERMSTKTGHGFALEALYD